MYGGLAAETAASRDAVDYTAGVVLVYGMPGQEHIFKAYFSSCCGGVTQSAADAFPGDPLIPPLTEQDVGSLCNASPHFNWGPVVVPKSELARSVRLWADRKARQDGHPRPESSIAAIARIDAVSANRFGRPVRFVLADSFGNQFSFTSEEMRSALNTDASPGTTLPSSFCRVDNGPAGASVIRFIDGHGFGHGVGMCQWCAEARAAQGMTHEQIVLLAFPHARLARAY
jgi:stage II sporulation protein D